MACTLKEAPNYNCEPDLVSWVLSGQLLVLSGPHHLELWNGHNTLTPQGSCEHLVCSMAFPERTWPSICWPQIVHWPQTKELIPGWLSGLCGPWLSVRTWVWIPRILIKPMSSTHPQPLLLQDGRVKQRICWQATWSGKHQNRQGPSFRAR